MEDALIENLRSQPVFAGIAVGPVAPHVRPDGSPAVGVRLDAAAPLGSLSRARLTVSIVCPREDDARCRALIDAVLAWRTVRALGSSPRVRGTPGRHKTGEQRCRFIPACAGNTATTKATTP